MKERVDNMKTYTSFSDFQIDYPTRADREKALEKMEDEQIDALIKGTNNIQGKIYLFKFKKYGKKEVKNESVDLRRKRFF